MKWLLLYCVIDNLKYSSGLLLHRRDASGGGNGGMVGVMGREKILKLPLFHLFASASSCSDSGSIGEGGKGGRGDNNGSAVFHRVARRMSQWRENCEHQLRFKHLKQSRTICFEQ